MATFWEIAAHSVDHMFSLYFDYLYLLVISRFGFEGWRWVLIASVQDLIIAYFFTFITQQFLSKGKIITLLITLIFSECYGKKIHIDTVSFITQDIPGHPKTPYYTLNT